MPTATEINAQGMPWPELDTWVNHLVISPDSKILVAACIDRSIRAWHPITCQTLGTYKGHNNAVRCILFSKDGKRFYSGADEGSIRIWQLGNPDAGSQVWNNAHKGAVRCLAMHPSGAIMASGGDDGIVRIWDLEKGMPLGSGLKHHTYPVSCLTFSSDGNSLVSGDEEGRLCIWTLDSLTLKYRSRTQTSNSVPITGIVALPNTNDVVTSCNDLNVRRWSISNVALVGKPWGGHTDSVRCISLLKGKILTGSSDGTARIWDPESNAPIGDVWNGPQGGIETITTDQSGKLAVTAGANELWSWMIE